MLMMIVVIVTIVTSGVHAPRDSGNREAGEAVLMPGFNQYSGSLNECGARAMETMGTFEPHP